ncbi:MAG: class I SAM-dependent methyltransferase [Pseudomonadota bacterium]|nr:class I SAM-dependent methyltransferase [Pseudomonadota bacterium]
MSGDADRRAWGDFWQTRRGDSGYPQDALERIDAVQQACWEEFARELPRGARVLDLATGSGVVLSRMQRVRRDLKLIGVDSAPVLPPAPKGIALKPQVAMEKLPFADASFTAVTSQFGFEYGDTAAIGAEVGRLLRSGGQARFLMHHVESPIVAHHLGRREALLWAAAESGYLEQARALAAARRLARLPTPHTFREAVSEARSRFPDQPVAEEFVAAILQTLELGERAPPADVLKVLETLEERAASELARIESLGRAVCDAERVERIRDDLDAAGLQPEPAEPLSEPGPQVPFGWLLTARRR